MAEQKAFITAEPVWIPESMILYPRIITEKPAEISAVPFLAPVSRKRLIINIETTGFSPLEDRIIAVGLQDPEMAHEAPVVIMIDDEKAMLNALFTVIQENGYKEFVGYGLSFDYRFILLRAMYHDINCKEFYDCELYDLMQAVAQGKLKYVYFPQKALKLSDVADFLWKYPKPFTDLEMLKYYKLGQFNKVIEFASSQITRIMALYILFRKLTESPYIFTASEAGSSSSIETTPKMSLDSSLLTIPEAHAPEMVKLHCDSCLADFEVTREHLTEMCPICSAKLVRK